MNELQEQRNQFRHSLIKHIERKLVGPCPWNGMNDEDPMSKFDSPQKKYIAGVLFPQENYIEDNDSVVDDMTTIDSDFDDFKESNNEESGSHNIDAGAMINGNSSGDSSDENAGYDEPINLSNEYKPSTMGMTFSCVMQDNIELVVECAASKYKLIPESDKYKREAQQWINSLKPLDFINKTTRIELVEKKLSLWMKVRRKYAQLYITLALQNKEKGGSRSIENCWYQAALQVKLKDGGAFAPIKPIMRPKIKTNNSNIMIEDESLELLYKDYPEYAIGHGCSANWEKGNRSDEIEMISTSIFPAVELPPILPSEKKEDGQYTDMSFLSSEDKSNIIAQLKKLPEEYECWVQEKELEAKSFSEYEQGIANKNLLKCRDVCKRMVAGIELLSSNKDAFTAFRDMNLALLMQQVHFKRKLREPDDNQWETLPETYCNVKSKWRIFQIAFILMNIPSIIHDSNGKHFPDRELVDLIWFPTGGGKTEAYLGLSALSIFYRRLLDPKDDGTTILMRYTLRLLTSQQFSRAASLICACEKIREDDIEKYGVTPITIGYFAGSGSSPNKRSEAKRSFDNLDKYGKENPFQLLKCPWCGTALNKKDKLGYIYGIPYDYGFKLTKRTVFFQCPESQCRFSKNECRALPVLVIDEDIYDSPPTLVIGTVDKFANLAYQPLMSRLFGLRKKEEKSVSPPDLIIQDELHLISGPLGSTVGIYESAIEILCSICNSFKPKIVASTATIKRAVAQCKGLYNREVCQFPPQGISISDSFFAKEDRGKLGRIYIGVLGTAAPSVQTAQVRLAAELMQGVYKLDLPDNSNEDVRDPYWTLVEYFNSKRELGQAGTLFRQDILEYIRTINTRNYRDYDKSISDRPIHNIRELWSALKSEEIPDIIKELEIPYDHLKSFQDSVDVVLATNMISVGVDIGRLGLMVMVGQPKTTSEYIQASSRVGRNADSPGIVLTLYNPSRSRDRSHYEHFKSYHETFYKIVEPTSVTPFSIPAIEKYLKAILIILARNVLTLKECDINDSEKQKLNDLFCKIKKRGSEIENENVAYLEETWNKFIKQWEDYIEQVINENAEAKLKWGNAGKPNQKTRCLMYSPSYNKPDEWGDIGWTIYTSMRNVDAECSGVIIPDYSADDVRGNYE